LNFEDVYEYNSQKQPTMAEFEEHISFDNCSILVAYLNDSKNSRVVYSGLQCQVGYVSITIQKSRGSWICRGKPKCISAFIVQRIEVAKKYQLQGLASKFLQDMAQYGCTCLQSVITPGGRALGESLKRCSGWSQRVEGGDDSNYYSDKHK
jgi:hypothetical protein